MGMEQKQQAAKKTPVLDRMLDFIERTGNKLPHPVTLFVIIAAVVVVASALMSAAGTSVVLEQVDKATQTVTENHVVARSLLDADGIRFMFEKAVTNFTGFAPVGVVLVAMLGIATADGTGLLSASLRKLLANTPSRVVTAMVVFIGVMSNVASDSGYVVVVPLGAMIFLGLKRHPMAGIAAAFFGVAGGFSANLLLGSIDPLLGSFSTMGARILDAGYYVSPVANYYFMFGSTFLITIIGTIITEKVTEPRLGKYTGNETASMDPLTPAENRGLRWALIALILSTVAVLLLVLPENALLRNQENGQILGDSPFMTSIVIIVTLLFFFPGLCYGIGAGTIRDDKQLVNIISDSMGTMGSYLVLTFVASQFVAYFQYSNIGLILAVKGAELLRATHATGLTLMVIFVFVAAFINLFIGSAVTKWSVMAPVFVPMFMMLGLSPEATQLAFRIGDSATNIISPLMPFFAIVLTIAAKYDKKMGIGTMVSIMLPYSITLLILWTLFMIAWVLLGLPIGPGVVTFLS